jgi:hypothetical protein
MALYHFSVKQISRGKGQTVVGSAAYISGEKLYNEYYDETHDYTRKRGVLFTEIMAPDYVPKRLHDRETLWNEVERVEKNKRAQLAYSFNIALQNELTIGENIELARQFCMEQFVSRGMIVDMAVHEGDSEDPVIPDNPHFHVIIPIRPVTEDGSWGSKQKREYLLDSDGNRVRDKNGNYVFNAVSTTGWNSPELLAKWREAWADTVNDKFRANGLAGWMRTRLWSWDLRTGFCMRRMMQRTQLETEPVKAVVLRLMIWRGRIAEVPGMEDRM